MFDSIVNAHGEALDFSYTPVTSAWGTVVIGHGVTANKDRAWAIALFDALQAAGFGALRFSFSGNGDSQGDFRHSTISKELCDLGSVLDTLQRYEIPQLIYVGHSMGGTVGVLRAVIDPRIKALVSLAGMVHTATFAERKFGGLQPGRDLMWDKPECPLSAEFVEDMMKIRSVASQAEQVRCPWLLIHGTADTVVPFADSSQIATVRTDVELIAMSDCDHLFSDHEQEMAQHLSRWLLQHSPASPTD